METPAEPRDVVTIQPAPAGENERYGALASQFRGDVPWRAPVLTEKLAQYIDGIVVLFMRRGS